MASSRIIAQILLLASSIQVGISFSIIVVQNQSTSLKASLTDTNSNNPKKVERVSVCLGELCKCQEESSELILQDLQSRNLPYVVEDAPCLGACGMGAMVSIDYQDGGFDLVCGMEETHAAVGITQLDGPSQSAEEKQDVELMNDLQQIMEEAEPAQINKENSDEDDENLTDMESNVLQIGSDLSKEEEKSASTDVTTTDEAFVENEVDHGAVQRMREEVKTATEEQTNPWLNMALYLGKKAKESIMK